MIKTYPNFLAPNWKLENPPPRNTVVTKSALDRMAWANRCKRARSQKTMDSNTVVQESALDKMARPKDGCLGGMTIFPPHTYDYPFSIVHDFFLMIYT